MKKKFLSLFFVLLSLFAITFGEAPLVSTIDLDETTTPRQIGLAMTSNPQTNININWTTLNTSLTNPKVLVWEKGTDESTAKTFCANVEKREVINSTIPGVKEKNFYSATIYNLKPGTEYNYRVGVEEAMSEVKSFKTAQVSNEEFTFLYFADPQMSGAHAKGWHAIQDIAKEMYPNAEFIYIAGDLTNTANDEGQWESFFNQPGNAQYNTKFDGNLIQELPVAATMGNHDGANAGIGGITSHFTWDSEVEGVPLTYAFSYGPARFIILNTQYNVLDSQQQFAQTEFLKKEVAEAKALGQWTIVGWHKPIYTGANHLDDSDVVASRKYWSSVLARLGVDVVLSGHDHVMSRGFVKEDGTKEDVTIKVYDRIYAAPQPDHAPLHYVATTGSTLKFYAPITSNEWIDENDPISPDFGFLDLNSSLPAGHPLNPLGPCTNDDLDGVDPNYIRYPTFVAVTISPNQIKLEAYFTGFDSNTNTILKDTFLYDSLTVQRDGVSKGIEYTTPQLKRLAVSLTTNKFTKIDQSAKINVRGKDYLENELNLSSFNVSYKTDSEEFINVSNDGVVTVKKMPQENKTVKVWVEASNKEKTVRSDKLTITLEPASK
ncbi:metallophosphoesterase family protein [Petrotoga sp. 9PWA.NaAc.5.4]|uniref:purple acid phosphatase family protein n=1 Tax=Petrotoga sp. 9PWA.NaAc.5.4 TaxID=1434328 RepID=UPI000CC1A614|nr:metallophosphoesterase family protein [Petrotoga sp. 9PWA.NaAc.5.4]PNR97215.1 hypothetical protein X924_00755 [Petrotoga sp. 9PWA.NaAc.5.4]